MKQKTILYPCTLDYSFLFQRPQQILRQLAKLGWRVIFCNNTQSGRTPEEVEPNLFVYHNFEEVLSLIKHNKIKIDVFYYTWAKSAQFADNIKAKINIYDSVDSFSDWYEFEEYATKRADIVLTSSQFLFDLRSKDKDSTYLIRNACPEDYIDHPSQVPDEYKKLSGPIVIFSGAIGSWVDTRLIRKVANRYTTVLVGQEFGKECPSNVLKLGTKSHEDLYNYYAHADVCLLPFNTKLEITQAACAIKMFEHMAAGKITVATKWLETDLYPDAVLTSESDEEFLQNVDRAIEMAKLDSHKQTCIDYAKRNTWELRVKQIEEAIEEYSLKSGVVIGS
ncbi:glycosyltransferase family protein [Paenibacillus xylanexedens]|uniref:glycosyltransferase family protein n=1 Tax=Paenibacillus xylanexedens TaxID=528191 RepID=UPI000F51F8D2|nr:glycosyltransferase [Paenibacillus xylanexedens]RPK31853.1 hypothetical protein EDO6_02480 [Paenibacillus xylanexedens]